MTGARISEPEPTCLRCDHTLTTVEVERGGRWKEFCEPCREKLREQFRRAQGIE